MNAPMSGTQKTVFAKTKGLDLPKSVKKLLIGGEIVWFDNNPLSQDFGEALHFYFDSHTKPTTDLILRRYGFDDVSQFINVKLRWRVQMDLVYSMPNRGEGKRHIESQTFEFYNTMYPMCDKFIDNRDKFYLLKNMEFLAVPDDNKNKKVYETTKFTAVVVDI